MNYTGSTQIEEGSKWLKKHKIRDEVKEKQAIEREDQGRQRRKEDGSWTTQQVEEDTNGCFREPHGEEGRIDW